MKVSGAILESTETALRITQMVTFLLVISERVTTMAQANTSGKMDLLTTVPSNRERSQDRVNGS
jgi:hypothetical protein